MSDKTNTNTKVKSKLRDDILSMDDLNSQEIAVTEWDNTKIKVKSLTAEQRYNLLSQCMTGENVDGMKLYVYTAITCAYDPETDEQIFDESDFDLLKTKSSNAIEQIVTVANELNGIGEQEVKVAEKN